MSKIMDSEELTLSRMLGELIRKKCINVTELSRRTNIPQPTIQRIVKGIHLRPHQKTLESIAKYFDISLHQLLGMEPIPWLLELYKKRAQQIPLLNSPQILKWPHLENISNDHRILVDLEMGRNSFAMIMPDPSMEPLITEGSILLIDPDKEPHYRSYVLLRTLDHSNFRIRQLITDGSTSFVKPLNPDFEHFKMQPLSKKEKILGVIVQVRINCK